MKKVRIAAIGDLHIQQGLPKSFKEVFEEISKSADILVLCGDLTSIGRPIEAEILAEELNSCKIPVIGVLGNHDFTNDAQEEIKKILSSKMFFLDHQSFTFEDIGFAGVKGFGGGFDKYIVTPFGEPILKQFVYEAINEATKLQEALSNLETVKKVAVLHYAPILQTIEGESLEVYPMLGTSRLLAPIESFEVNLVLHGHAHHGKPIGKTPRGIPVYNVSFPLLSRLDPQKPYLIIEI